MLHLFKKEEIGDFIVTMFEGGSNYWVDSITISREECPDAEYFDVVMEGGQIAVVELEGDGSEQILNKKVLDRGVDILLQRYPRYFRELVTGEWDVEAADALLQCSLFGDIVYG